MKTSKIIITLFFFAFMAQFSSGQTVNYKVKTNSPKSAKVSIGISPLDFFFIDGEPMGGPGVDFYIRPVDRLRVHGRLSSAMYLNKSREDENASGIKKLGGIIAEAHGEYVWLRKGINLTDGSGNIRESRFNVKSTGNTTKYINFPYNRVVERSIRAGAFHNNFPLQSNTQSVTGVFVGLSRTGRRYAKLELEGYGDKDQGLAMGYYLDFMFGGVNAVDASAPVESGSGFRLGFDIEATGGLCPVITTFELGKMPGANGFMRLMFTFALQSGANYYEGPYKERKAATKKIPGLIRSL
ncbi:MAG: hypothetical protein MRZ79_01355 [Bacteroidia bacterium]|nr:hypothetical protein [Bacteroidia bacterium]